MADENTTGINYILKYIKIKKPLLKVVIIFCNIFVIKQMQA